MRSIKTSLMAVTVVVATSVPLLADYMVKEVGSFHVGGRTVALSGMPTARSLSLPLIKVDPNASSTDVRGTAGAAEQESRSSCSTRRPQRRHWSKPGGKAPLAAVLSQCRL
jgi:hypothetical protein